MQTTACSRHEGRSRPGRKNTATTAQPLEVPMIEARGLVKHYRSALAVDHLSFDVRPGTVTGFLGPNGAGKPATRLWHLKPRAAKPQVRARTCLSVAINDHGSLATTLGRLSGVPGCY